MKRYGSSLFQRSLTPAGGRESGFTLVELMVVVVIIALLAVVALPRFARTRDKAYRSQMQTALRTLVTTQESYFDDFLIYADNISNLNYNVTPMVTLEIVQTAGNGWSAKATHQMTASECMVYVGPVAPVGGIPDNGEGIISCS